MDEEEKSEPKVNRKGNVLSPPDYKEYSYWWVLIGFEVTIRDMQRLRKLQLTRPPSSPPGERLEIYDSDPQVIGPHIAPIMIIYAYDIISFATGTNMFCNKKY